MRGVWRKLTEILNLLYQQRQSFLSERDKYGIAKKDNPRLFDWYNAKAEATSQNIAIIEKHMKGMAENDKIKS